MKQDDNIFSCTQCKRIYDNYFEEWFDGVTKNG